MIQILLSITSESLQPPTYRVRTTVDKIKKLYYSISEVSESTGLAPHVLRYWETEFPELQPKKNRAGNRVYTDEDMEVLDRIQRLLREDKYTLEGARQALKRAEGAGEADPAFRRELTELKAFLAELLDRI
jgi:DNA-binding transcriptional MerR regulator